MNPQDEHQDAIHTSAHNPFPEPQTIPAGWDTSEFFPAPPPGAVEQADDQAEDKSK